MHLGGKLEVVPREPIRNRYVSRAYTPGVARVCLAIAEDKHKARALTVKRNTIAVVTDGSAVLGLGNIGPEAAPPVMAGKAALFEQFAGSGWLHAPSESNDRTRNKRSTDRVRDSEKPKHRGARERDPDR